MGINVQITNSEKMFHFSIEYVDYCQNTLKLQIMKSGQPKSVSLWLKSEYETKGLNLKNFD